METPEFEGGRCTEGPRRTRPHTLRGQARPRSIRIRARRGSSTAGSRTDDHTGVEMSGELPSGEALERLLGAGCPDAVIVADRDGIICHWNGAAESLFGHPAATVLGRPLDLIIPE